MSEWNYVIAAYAVAWAGLLGYAGHLVRSYRRGRAAVQAAGGQS